MQRLSSPEKYQFVSEAYSAGFFVLLLPLLLIGRYFGKGLIIAKGTTYLGLDCFDQVTKSTILPTSPYSNSRWRNLGQTTAGFSMAKGDINI